MRGAAKRSAAQPQTKAGGINRGIRPPSAVLLRRTGEIRGKQTPSRSPFRVFRVFRGLSRSRSFVAACEQIPLLQCRRLQKVPCLCVSPRSSASLRLCVKTALALVGALPRCAFALVQLRSSGISQGSRGRSPSREIRSLGADARLAARRRLGPGRNRL